MTNTTTDAAEARALVREALEPFAQEADRLYDSISDDVGYCDDITYGDLRRARTALNRLATAEAASGAGEREECGASPDHADILETIANAADDWQKQGYVTALAEVRDMANVGRALMEALPDGYHYMNCPSEIVTDLQNERDEALASLSPATDPAMVTVPRTKLESIKAAGRYVPVGDGYFDPYGSVSEAVDAAVNAALAAAPTIPATGEGGQ